MAFGKKAKEEVKVSAEQMRDILKMPTDGLVHAEIYLISATKVGEAWGSGKDLDKHLVMMQEAGAEILSVTPYSGQGGDSTRCSIIYRAPSVSYAL